MVYLEIVSQACRLRLALSPKNSVCPVTQRLNISQVKLAELGEYLLGEKTIYDWKISFLYLK